MYNLSESDYWRIWELQGRRCYICQRATGARKRLAVDHDHETGKVRALLCGPCNFTLIGRYDAQALARAIMVLTTQPAQQLLQGDTDGR